MFWARGLHLQRAGGAADAVVDVRPDALRGEVPQPADPLLRHAARPGPGARLPAAQHGADASASARRTSTTSGSPRRSASPRTTSRWALPRHVPRDLRESIFDSAEVETAARPAARCGRRRVARHHRQGDRLQRVAADGRQGERPVRRATARTPPAKLNQILCRKEQQMLYLALRQAQHAVDLITEDDIVERDVLKDYDVVYFAGEWIDRRAVQEARRLGARPAACCTRRRAWAIATSSTSPRPAMLKLLGPEGATTNEERRRPADAAGAAAAAEPIDTHHARRRARCPRSA